MPLGCTTLKLRDLSLWIRSKGTPATRLQPRTKKENFDWACDVDWQRTPPQLEPTGSRSRQELGLFRYSFGDTRFTTSELALPPSPRTFTNARLSFVLRGRDGTTSRSHSVSAISYFAVGGINWSRILNAQAAIFSGPAAP